MTNTERLDKKESSTPWKSETKFPVLTPRIYQRWKTVKYIRRTLADERILEDH